MKINIKRPFYTMAETVDNEAEISMYGDIVERRPINYQTGEPAEGSFILQDEFLNDLNTVVASGCKKLTLRMNSYGGDAGVSIVIHNRLREISASGIETVCIVDGLAMSGGSLIMCACDNVRVNPSSLIMIHKAWSLLFGGYNADEMRSKAKENDAWDKAQVEIYKRKCGLSDTVIMHMMSETTTMTGREAVEKGFANEVIEDAEPITIAASADRRSLVVCGKTIPLSGRMKAPESIPTISTSRQEDGINTNQSGSDTDSNEGGNLMATNLNELRSENPELAATVEREVRAAMSADNTDAINQATEVERNRLAEIDQIAQLYDDETVREAKYGEHPCTAQELAFRAAQNAAKSGSAFVAGMRSDYANSGAANVSAIPAADDNAEPSVKDSAKAAVEMFNKIKEGKR